MAEGKLISLANAGGAVTGAIIGAAGMFIGMGDTSPKSLEGMASALERIADNLEKVDEIDPDAAEDAAALLGSVDAIGSLVAAKASSTGVALPGVDAILVTDEGTAVGVGQTQSMILGNGDRVSVTYLTDLGNNRFRMSVNAVQKAYYVGARVYESEDGACFVELTGKISSSNEVVIRPVCN